MEQLLIVEDDRSLNKGLSRALETASRQVVSCFDLRTAREQLACGGVSAVILDINLPDGSGLELLREVKSSTPSLPVILLTANDTDTDIVNGLEQGADDYITKPCSLAVLRARVNTQLRKSSLVLSKEIFRSVCREFNVNEDWLRNGKGEMFEQSVQFDVAEYAKNCSASELELALAQAYFNLPKEIRALLMDELVRCVLGNTAPVSRAELEALEARIAAIERGDTLNGLGGGVSGKNVR